MAQEVVLTKTWQLGRELGSGGFGAVYEATNSDGEIRAVKLIQKQPGASRELLMVELGDSPNVIPVLDTGETADHYALLMPKAETPLDVHLRETGVLSVSEATAILIDVAAALAALATRGVVHRDLKPGNILKHEGHWCLGDFGIARYIDATTATETLKYAKSDRYAAPERWRGETATPAVDIYALGVTAYEMLAGHRPFDDTDLRNSHLHVIPPPIEGLSPALGALIDEMLIKAPEGRPGAADVLARLEKQLQRSNRGGALSSLEHANQQQVRRELARSAEAGAEMSAEERRTALRRAGAQIIQRVRDAVLTELSEAAPSAKVDHTSSGWSIALNEAVLIFRSINIGSAPAWGGAPGPFDVVEIAEIILAMPPNSHGYRGRSHSLWYCDAKNEGQFKWYETAFMGNPLTRRGSHDIDPYTLPPEGAAAAALSNVITTEQVAWPFTELVVGELDEFIERWAGWFGAAASRQLGHPSAMPERSPNGSWRQRPASRR